MKKRHTITRTGSQTLALPARAMWQRENMCGACGGGEYVGRPVDQTPIAYKSITRRRCRSVNLNMPGGRCNWPMTVLYILVPA